MTVVRRFAVPGLAAVALLGCGSDSQSSATEDTSRDTAPVSTTIPAPPDGTGPGFTLKMHNSTGENPFTQLAYECDQCTFEQFAAVEPPPGWSKGPTQVILPAGELRGTPSFDGVPSSPELPSQGGGSSEELSESGADSGNHWSQRRGAPRDFCRPPEAGRDTGQPGYRPAHRACKRSSRFDQCLRPCRKHLVLHRGARRDGS